MPSPYLMLFVAGVELDASKQEEAYLPREWIASKFKSGALWTGHSQLRSARRGCVQLLIMSHFGKLWTTAEKHFSVASAGNTRRETWKNSYEDMRQHLSDPHYQNDVYGLDTFRDALQVAKGLHILIHGAVTCTVGDNIIEQRLSELTQEMEQKVWATAQLFVPCVRLSAPCQGSCCCLHSEFGSQGELSVPHDGPLCCLLPCSSQKTSSVVGTKKTSR